VVAVWAAVWGNVGGAEQVAAVGVCVPAAAPAYPPGARTPTASSRGCDDDDDVT